MYEVAMEMKSFSQIMMNNSWNVDISQGSVLAHPETNYIDHA